MRQVGMKEVARMAFAVALKYHDLYGPSSEQYQRAIDKKYPIAKVGTSAGDAFAYVSLNVLHLTPDEYCEYAREFLEGYAEKIEQLGLPG